MAGTNKSIVALCAYYSLHLSIQLTFAIQKLALNTTFCPRLKRCTRFNLESSKTSLKDAIGRYRAVRWSINFSVNATIRNIKLTRNCQSARAYTGVTALSSQNRPNYIYRTLSC